MLLRSLLLLIWLMGSGTAAVGAERFPYRAVVNSDDVYIRSGPGQDYYATGKAHLGEEVEVYRHDPGGWLAIRPPQGSFSWISARYLEPEEGDLAVVVADGVVARVGSEQSDTRDVWQVKLDRGEKVIVLETLRSGSGTWCKIAPPAGEFRWISGQFVDPAAPRSGRSDELGESTPSGARGSDRRPATTMRSSRSSDDANWGDDVPPPTRRSTTSSSSSTKPSSGEASGSQAPARSSGSPSTSQASRRSSESFASEACAMLDFELSKMVSRPPDQWSLASIYDRAEELVASGSPREQEEARTILARIERFEELRHEQQRLSEALARARPLSRTAGVPGRSAMAAPPTAGLQPTSPRVAAAPGNRPPVRPAAPAQREPLPREALNGSGETGRAGPAVVRQTITGPSDEDRRYDARGRLAPVESNRGGTPAFALLDENGEFLYYVRSTPDVNLRMYANRTVGLNGLRSYNADVRAEQIQVQKITVLPDAVRRR